MTWFQIQITLTDAKRTLLNAVQATEDARDREFGRKYGRDQNAIKSVIPRDKIRE